MRKTILALAIPAATFMASAHAATVYNADGTKLDVYGRMQADMTNAGASKQSSKSQADTKSDLTTSARLGVKGETRVNDSVKVFAKGEWQVAAQNSDGNKFSTRKAYIGADFGKGGQLSVGQQDTVIYTSLVSTVDIFDKWGMEAQEGIYGESRQAGQLVYSNSFGNFDLQAGYQFRNSDGNDIGGINSGTQQDNAYSLAGVYHSGVGLNIRAAYARQNFGDSSSSAYYTFDSTTGTSKLHSAVAGNANGKIDTYGLGADYSIGNLYLAAVYLGSKTDDGSNVSGNKTNINSYDLVGAYTIDQYRIFTGYGLQHKSTNDGSASFDSVKSYKLGLEYNITSNALAWVEYRHNNADGTNDGANGYGSNEVTLSGRYNF